MAYATASETGRRPIRRIRSLSVSPSTYSKTMYGAPSSSPASITVTTWGWLSCATARASRRKRSSWSGSVEMSRCMSLIATQRSSVGSNARYTLDIPPDPTFSSSRKRPPISVPITVIYFALSDACRCSLLHGSCLSGVLGRGACPAQAHVGVRQRPLDYLCDGRSRPPVRRSREHDRAMVGHVRTVRDAGRPAALVGGTAVVLVPGLHGGKGGAGAGF